MPRVSRTPNTAPSVAAAVQYGRGSKHFVTASSCPATAVPALFPQDDCSTLDKCEHAELAPERLAARNPPALPLSIVVTVGRMSELLFKQTGTMNRAFVAWHSLLMAGAADAEHRDFDRPVDLDSLDQWRLAKPSRSAMAPNVAPIIS